MNLRRAVLWLLAAHLVADGVCWPLAVGRSFPFPALIIAYALAFSQVSLLVIWACLDATTTIGVRLAAMVGGYLLAVPLLGLLHENHSQWFFLLSVQVGVVLLPLVVARLLGIQLERHEPAATPSARRSFQFSLWHLMASITALAAVCGIARHFDLDQVHDLDEGVFIGVGFAAVALTAVWSGLGAGRAWLRAGVLLVTSALIGYSLAVIAAPRDLLAFTILVALQTGLLGGSLGVLRACGYRLTRVVG